MELYKHSNTKKMEQEAKGCIITGPRGQEWEKNPRIYRRHKIIQQTEQIKRISLKNINQCLTTWQTLIEMTA